MEYHRRYSNFRKKKKKKRGLFWQEIEGSPFTNKVFERCGKCRACGGRPTEMG
jgi:hypothetical protein